MKQIKILALIILGCFAVNTAIAGEQAVNQLKARIEQGEKLSLEQCIELAVENNPNILAARSTIKAHEGKIGQSRSNFLPQINLSSGYSRRNTQTTSSVDDSSNSYSGSISLNQLIYDFGKTSTQVKISRLGLEGASAEVQNVVNNIVYSVKVSYYKVLFTLQTKKVREESVEQYQKQLEQAQAFYKEGLKPKIDVTTAETNLSNAEFNLIKAENEVKSAFADLNNAIGIPEALDYTLADSLKYNEYNIAFSSAIEQAYTNRPDLKGVILKESAAKESVKLNKKEYLPELKAVSGYGLGGNEFPLDDSWSVGAEVTLPVFNGLLTHNKIKEAKANLEVAEYNQEILMLNIFRDVKKAHISFEESKKRIPVSEKALKQAKETFELATGRYKVGVGNPIEVKDAEVTYSNAKLSYYQTIYDYNVARSNLEKVIGSK